MAVDIKKLVVDGPPCSGKTTIMAKLIEHFTGLGFPVVTIPEAATELMMSGVMPDSFYDENLFQKCLVEKILYNEQFFSVVLKRMARCKNNKLALMFCDRGLMSGYAYCDPMFFSQIILDVCDMHTDETLNSYAGVLHMRIAPEKYYTRANNSARSEGYLEACKLDNKTLQAWSGHPNLMIVGNDYKNGFAGKVNAALQAVSKLLRVPEPLVIERKFLVSNSSKNTSTLAFLNLCTINAVRVRIEQHYLAPDGRESLRAWTKDDGITIYFYRKKSNEPCVERISTEKIITQNEYDNLLRKIDPKCAPIKKTRYYFTYGDQYFRLDVFDHNNDNYILEVQPTTLHRKIEIPEFFGNVKDVTNNAKCYNYNIARWLAEQGRTKRWNL